MTAALKVKKKVVVLMKRPTNTTNTTQPLALSLDDIGIMTGAHIVKSTQESKKG
ncbi:hypothetical protein L917_10207 [Phytophthora nicotianae]|uniref:Uncharacterized protein n=3 Tax=Phytophthora nicotianae TaxID=4792 RepID=W2R9N4_PHYN3|nr:hypothetical protein PPTG_02005 [Phytophthora nicotianae INRA-310]ETK84690.1 hypothetical protein L915_10372 [Phytophthora nicotianae]ETO66713.1 hypothetical protein F444_16202 [Phytophthora nicotianae P1976]ETL38121.1 hypothetical protein L916_10272 [Phytophthora nicotianae]ETL91225.1 hypothetical protein L917_10207 [Phytophthora nicotianae]ETN21936.1 hypothetical protein PPTG_02005 [Phytophthora nicotianae INRA-310]